MEIKSSYCLKILERIELMSKVIRQTKQSIEEAKSRLELILSKIEEEIKLKNRVQEIESRIKLLNLEYLNEEQRLQEKQLVFSQNQILIKQKKNDLMSKFQEWNQDNLFLEEKKNQLLDEKNKLISINFMRLLKRNKLIKDLYQIYPIETCQGGYSICNVHLPDFDHFKGHNGFRLSVGLGYLCHFLLLFSKFMDIPLRYCIVYNGSLSSVIDHILPNLEDSKRVFPLYLQNASKRKFLYGVSLINENIIHLRHYFSLTTTNVDAILPNLHSLIESKVIAIKV